MEHQQAYHMAASINIAHHKVNLVGDYMIPFSRDEILSRLAGIPAVL